jgi:hypothetical protein
MDDERERRIAQNEVLWREINELVATDPGVLNRVFCECGRVGCSDVVAMTADEYRSVRAQTTTFVVAPGHEIPDVEHVVADGERFRVVEKEGTAAVIADQAAP